MIYNQDKYTDFFWVFWIMLASPGLQKRKI